MNDFEATAEISESVQRGMVARRILDGGVRNVYKIDVGKLAAWTSASHIEPPPKEIGSANTVEEALIEWVDSKKKLAER